MARRFDLVVLGEIHVDMILTGDAQLIWGQHEKLIDDARLVAGGSSTIMACGAARLGLRPRLALSEGAAFAIVENCGRAPLAQFGRAADS